MPGLTWLFDLIIMLVLRMQVLIMLSRVILFHMLIDRGSIPIPKMKLPAAWIELHKDELLADWELVVTGQQPYKIDPYGKKE